MVIDFNQQDTIIKNCLNQLLLEHFSCNCYIQVGLNSKLFHIIINEVTKQLTFFNKYSCFHN